MRRLGDDGLKWRDDSDERPRAKSLELYPNNAVTITDIAKFVREKGYHVL